MSRDFERQLRDEEAARLRAGMPRERRDAVWERVEHPRRSSRTLRFALIPAVAVIAAAVVFIVTRPPAELGGLAVRHAEPGLLTNVEADGAVEIARGGATLDDVSSGLQLDVSPGVRVQRQQGGVRVFRGRVSVAAVHRNAGQSPAVVFVSDGAIEVMGTHFDVVQEAQGGTVTLHDGHIRFRATDGRTVELEPGGSLAWPLPAPVAVESPPEPVPSEPEPIEPAPVPAKGTLAPADALLHEVDVLRSRHEYERAAALLEGAPAKWPKATRERLSFELGLLYSHSIADPKRACHQWKLHAQRFPRGRYAAEVEQSKRELACDPSP